MIVFARTIAGLLIASNAVVAAAANYVLNPDFATDAGSWTLVATGSATATFDNTSGSPATGSVHLSATNGDTAKATQCIVAGGQNVDIRAREFIANLVPPIFIAAYNIIGFDGAGCTGEPTIGFTADAPVSGFPGFIHGAAQDWQEFSILNQPLPASTVSVLINLYIQPDANGVADYYFDDVRLVPAGTTPVTLQSFYVE